MTQRGRLTVFSNISIQGTRYKPIGVALRYDRELGDTEQPYERIQPSPTEWAKLDLGWIEKPALIIIQYSREARVPLLVTGSVLSEAAGLTAGLVLQILAGEALSFHPVPGQSLYVKGDGSPMTITAVSE